MELSIHNAKKSIDSKINKLIASDHKEIQVKHSIKI